MTDDIVTRLRERGEWDTHPMGGKEWFPDELCEEAADKIERLQQDLIETVMVCYQMARQHCQTDDALRLDSRHLGINAHAMRICDRYGLFDEFYDWANRHVEAKMFETRDIEVVLAKAVHGD
jgi:hypothetical protein